MNIPEFEISTVSAVESEIQSVSTLEAEIGTTSTSGTWSSIAGKPFETIGTGLAVSSGALNVTAVGGNVDDVKVNGTSVVTDKIANVTVPTKTSDITNDSGFITNSYHDSTKEDAGKITISGTAYTASKHTLSWTNNGTTYSYEVVTV